MEKPVTETSRVSVEEFTQAVFTSVLRAIETRSRVEPKLPTGPIIYGIIWYPESMGGVPGEFIQPAAPKEARKG